MQLRPSALPKLALCGQYSGKPGASAEAARGTIIDNAFRAHAMGLLDEWPDSITPMDAQNIAWAIYELRELAQGVPLNHSRNAKRRHRRRVVSGTALVGGHQNRPALRLQGANGGVRYRWHGAYWVRPMGYLHRVDRRSADRAH